MILMVRDTRLQLISGESNPLYSYAQINDQTVL